MQIEQIFRRFISLSYRLRSMGNTVQNGNLLTPEDLAHFSELVDKTVNELNSLKECTMNCFSTQEVIEEVAETGENVDG